MARGLWIRALAVALALCLCQAGVSGSTGKRKQQGINSREFQEDGDQEDRGAPAGLRVQGTDQGGSVDGAEEVDRVDDSSRLIETGTVSVEQQQLHDVGEGESRDGDVEEVDDVMEGSIPREAEAATENLGINDSGYSALADEVLHRQGQGKETSKKETEGAERSNGVSASETKRTESAAEGSEKKKDRLVIIMEMLFARRDVRDVRKAVQRLEELTAELGREGSSFPLWRPTKFASDDDPEGKVSAFSTDPDGSVDLGNGWTLVRARGPGSGGWTLRKKTKPRRRYIYGSTKETLEYYGQGAGAPSAEVEYSGVSIEDSARVEAIAEGSDPTGAREGTGSAEVSINAGQPGGHGSLAETPKPPNSALGGGDSSLESVASGEGSSEDRTDRGADPDPTSLGPPAGSSESAPQGFAPEVMAGSPAPEPFPAPPRVEPAQGIRDEALNPASGDVGKVPSGTGGPVVAVQTAAEAGSGTQVEGTVGAKMGSGQLAHGDVDQQKGSGIGAGKEHLLNSALGAPDEGADGSPADRSMTSASSGSSNQSPGDSASEAAPTAEASELGSDHMGRDTEDDSDDDVDEEEEESSNEQKPGWSFGPSGWTYTGTDTAQMDLEAAASDAMFLLGLLSATGLTPDSHPRNDTRAVEELSRAADTGSLQAILALANRYLQGRGVEKNCRAALWYMKTVADRVLADAEKSGDFQMPKEPFQMREYLRDGSYMAGANAYDNPEQVDMDEDQALHGVPAYQRHLGYRRLLGRGVERDPHAAYRHFQAAAGAGDEVAAFNLGYMHMNGLSTPVNYTAASEFFRTAAARNLPAAFNGLGVLHFNGWGTPVNYTQARRFFLQGAARNDSDSLYNLGIIHTDGYDVPRDPILGLKFFERAAIKGHWRAPYTVALMHAEGVGVPVNCTQAVGLLRVFVSERGSWHLELEQAALAYQDGDYWSALFRYSVVGEEGSVVGMENAAHMLRRGEGFRGPQRYDMALELLLRAADFGSHHSLIDIGHLYSSGLVSKKNSSKAVEYFQMAGARGEPEGLFSLAQLYQHGKLVPQNFTQARMFLEEALSISVDEEVVPVVLALWWLDCHVSAAKLTDFFKWSWSTVYPLPAGFLGPTSWEGLGWPWILLAGWDTVLVLVLSAALFVVYRLRLASQRVAAIGTAMAEGVQVAASGEVPTGDETHVQPIGASGEGSRNLHGGNQGLGASSRSSESGPTNFGGEGNGTGLHQRRGLRVGSTS